MRKVILFLMFSVSFFLAAQKSSDVRIVELNKQEFLKKVWNFEKNKNFTRVGEGPVILDFHAVWCGPCKMIAPHLQLLQNKYKGKLTIYKIDVDKEPEIAELFKAHSIPTIIFIGQKNKYFSELGYREYEELEQMARKYLFNSK